MKTYIALFFGILIYCVSINAQEGIVYDDRIYDKEIGASEFRLRGQYTSYPMLNLSGYGAVVLSFDDFRDENRYFNYKLILCNADWTPSELEDSEYINGFNDNEIEDFEFSFNTRARFINYRVQIPNDDLSITKSGNYILYVYDTETDLPVLTKKLLVLQEKLVINAEVTAPPMVEFRSTHHEIDFEVLANSISVSNPDSDLKVSILQNWRWDNAIHNIKPRYVQGETINYDYNNKLKFEAGNEFRNIDMRSFDFLSPSMEHIDVYDDGFGVHVKTEGSRYNSPYLQYRDLNGDYVIQDLEEFRRNNRQQLEATTDNELEIEQTLQANFNLDVEDMRENKLRSDYANVHFKLSSKREIYATDVFIVGRFCDWKLEESNRLIYDEAKKGYFGTLELKQGFYDYMYATVPKGQGEINLQNLEGSHYETRNEYIILIYHRGITDRHDKLVGYRSVFSSEN